MLAAIEIEGAVSSLRIRPLAEAVPRMAPLLGPDRVTRKPSSGSTWLSPWTRTLQRLAGLPGGKGDELREGQQAVREVGGVGGVGTGAGHRPGDRGRSREAGPSGLRQNRRRYRPLDPFIEAGAALPRSRSSATPSSLRSRPVADAVPWVGLDRVTRKFSSGSTWVSPRTLTPSDLLASPTAKAILPEGSTPLRSRRRRRGWRRGGSPPKGRRSPSTGRRTG